MKETPFYNFFRFFYENKINTKEFKRFPNNIDALIECYSEEEYVFMLGNAEKNIDQEDISLLFGLPVAGANMEPLAIMTKDTVPSEFRDFVKINFQGKQYINREMVEERIKEDIKKKEKNNEDLPLLIIMEIIMTFLFPNNQQKIR